ncbi:DNA replication and repair protein RecF [Oceanibacterium hippocampi]|uniref:DNA replication and repair protein RecF n=2 Tax=Oceanibacterium hippocampi TaxID=745714 RepID=A0A1Y5RNJ5_9PROT|nr:DNA replication and repair protein RecF [Oceanibacterium hippocampi]
MPAGREDDEAAALHAPDTVRPARRLAAERLRLTDFRSYRALTLEVEPRPVVLTGPNGAGKTNLLEALSLLVPGRGLRGARLVDLARQGGDGGWAIAADVSGFDGQHRIGSGLRPAEGEGAASERRIVRIDGETASGPAALGGVLAATWLTPQMDRLFLDGPSGRRRFLDRLVYGIDPDHARRVNAYERTMRERSRLLRESRGDRTWLDALEAGMAELAVAIAAARRELLRELAGVMAQASGPFPRAGLALAGDVEGWLDEGPALAAEDRLRAALADARSRDGESGGAAAGPHRSDLLVRHVVKDMPAEHCSTGEQKALLVSIVLADARLLVERRRAVPLLLFDEVTAHLDAGRRAALLDEIIALGAQAWLTGTDRSLFEGFDGAAQFFKVEDGSVTRVVTDE